MTSTIKQKVEAAKEAINKVFGDRSGGVSNNIDALEELAAEIEVAITALKSDLDE